MTESVQPATPSDEPNPPAGGTFESEPHPPPLAVPVEVMQAEPVAPTLFCHRCGSPWSRPWAVCPYCRARQVRPLEPGHPSMGSGLGLFFALLATNVLIMVVRSFCGIEATISLLGVTVVDTIIVLAWSACSAPAAVGALFRRLPSAAWMLKAAMLGVASFLLAAAVIHALVDSLGIRKIEVANGFLDAGYGWAIMVLAMCVQPAVIEEMAFRGVVLDGLATSCGRWGTILVSAALFAVLHIAPFSMPHIFAMGIVLGWLRLRTGSLYPCMAMHFVHNLLCVIEETGAFWS